MVELQEKNKCVQAYQKKVCIMTSQSLTVMVTFKGMLCSFWSFVSTSGSCSF